MSRRPSPLLWVALAATLAATWYAAGVDAPAPADEALSVPERAPRPLPTGALPAPAAPDARPGSVEPAAGPHAERMAAPREPLMAPRAWLPPPPPPVAVAVAAPPPPQAPPLPYRYLGRLEDPQGGTTVFLAEGQGPQARPLAVRAGERLAQYQVNDVGANGMTLTYLPLNQKQQLLFGSPP